jgi:hypothetical protein
MLIDFKRRDLTRLLHQKITNQQVFNQNINQISNVREHPNKKILMPKIESEFQHERAILKAETDQDKMVMVGDLINQIQ